MKNPLVVLGKEIFKGKVFSDASLISLIASNIFTIIFALIEKWDFSTIIWVYWTQSVIIGLVAIVNILTLKDFSTEGLKGYDDQGRWAQPQVNFSTQRRIASFFFLHYGGFHAIYFLFLSLDAGIPNVKFILINSLIFLINHSFSLLYNRNEEQGKINIGSLMFMPYLRIIPMHFIIILSGAIMWLPGSNSTLLVIFLLIKTAVDAGSHIVEHAIKRKNSIITQ